MNADLTVAARFLEALDPRRPVGLSRLSMTIQTAKMTAWRTFGTAPWSGVRTNFKG